jgi:hypothetical protein
MPPNPKIAAISAMTKKVNAQPSMAMLSIAPLFNERAAGMFRRSSAQ